MSRWAWAEVDPSAITHNVASIAATVAPAHVWAVVKANGYGHGAVTAAHAALAGGATALCVALVQEGLELRAAGIKAPILVFGEQPPEQMAAAVAGGLALTLYSTAGVAALEACGAHAHPVHLDIDTGMHRVGCPPDVAVDLARRIVASPACRLAGTSTHFAIADVPTDPYTARQLAAFDGVLTAMRAAGIDPGIVHTANSAGALAHPAARHDAVRIGIAAYGLLPGPGVADHCRDLHPAMSLHARVSWVQRLNAGERISYGLRHTFTTGTTVATVPIGYADGVPRRLYECGGEVLIGGRRRPIVGVVTMDQLMVDCGDDPVAAGDPVVLLGTQGSETITADDWAGALGTIGYEIVCGISARIARRAPG